MPTFTDNSPIVFGKLRGALGRIGADWQEIVVESIQEKMLYGYHEPHGEDGHTEILDTGALFDSITARVSKQSQNLIEVQATGGTEYASYVHQGTYKLHGRPFITDGINEAVPKIRSAAESSLRNA